MYLQFSFAILLSFQFQLKDPHRNLSAFIDVIDVLFIAIVRLTLDPTCLVKVAVANGLHLYD
jgi:hypothetical protein